MSYQNFRKKHPQASLITKLIQIDRHLYMVQCQLTEKEIILSNALAEDDTVESAEDRAIQRALALLGFTDDSEVNNEVKIESKDLEYEEMMLKKLGYREIKSSINKIETEKTPVEILLESDFLTVSRKTPDNLLTEEESKTPESSLTSEEIPASIDFSDIIAKTNTELKRLDWTTQQGKEYLMGKYGKRSRQLLSDEELLEFLKHLESLPTPPGLF